jgi:hypothetical protein
MTAYYSDKDQLFVGVAPAGEKESALANAIAMAKAFYGTSAVDYEEAHIDQDSDLANTYVRIYASPQSEIHRLTDEQKEITIISNDPHRLIHIPSGGGIGIPFFTARGASLVLTRHTNGQASLAYVVTIEGLGKLSHTFEWPSTVYARLLRSTGQAEVAHIYLGNMSVNCNRTYLLTLRSRMFNGGLYPVIAKARIEFTLPRFPYSCEAEPSELALDANGGQDRPYFNERNGGHNANLHWKLEDYGSYKILVPRARQEVALDANGGWGNPYFNSFNGGHNANLHWKLEDYGSYKILVPRVRQEVALDANGGWGNPYFRALNGGHNANLHWKLEDYGSYKILVPRVRRSPGTIDDPSVG